MTTATAEKKSRQPKAKPTRTLQWDSLDSESGRLEIVVKTARTVERSVYFVERLTAETFRVTKRHAGEGRPDTYTVAIGEQPSCGCDGFTYCRASVKTCRHTAALQCLRTRGSI